MGAEITTLTVLIRDGIRMGWRMGVNQGLLLLKRELITIIKVTQNILFLTFAVDQIGMGTIHEEIGFFDRAFNQT